MADRAPRLTALALLLAVSVLAGCASPETPAPAAPSVPVAQEEPETAPQAPLGRVDRVVTGGTGIGFDALVIAGKAYEAGNPTYDVLVQPPVGSGGGIKAVLQQQYDMSVSGRALKDSEQGLVFTPLYKDAVVFVVNERAGVSELSLEQIAALYRGEITSWADVGGNDVPVRLYSREPEDSIAKKYMAAFPALHNSTWSSAVNVLNDDLALYGILGDTAGAAGFTVRQPMTLRDASVVFVTPDGVDASPEAVLSGAYPATLTVGIVAPPNLMGPAASFHAWLTGDHGKAVLRDAGYLTV